MRDAFPKCSWSNFFVSLLFSESDNGTPNSSTFLTWILKISLFFVLSQYLLAKKLIFKNAVSPVFCFHFVFFCVFRNRVRELTIHLHRFVKLQKKNFPHVISEYFLTRKLISIKLIKSIFAFVSFFCFYAIGCWKSKFTSIFLQNCKKIIFRHVITIPIWQQKNQFPRNAVKSIFVLLFCFFRIGCWNP